LTSLWQDIDQGADRIWVQW